MRKAGYYWIRVSEEDIIITKGLKAFPRIFMSLWW